MTEQKTDEQYSGGGYMVIYEVIQSYFNGCDVWTTSVDIFKNKIDAEQLVKQLEDANTDPDNQDYYIVDRWVK